ncbi:MAG TPA: 50S ribosomal protein L9 [Pyrinomonadaceae bacterium]|nr:50S ribosomal protein L9 [Pyrinomonadaceae bacterium]
MANTTILLREDVEALGGRGEIVKVKAGYARNYLLPQGLATLATKGNVKQIEQERAALLKRAAEEKATAELQKEQMGVIALAFERKAGDGGTLFGSITSMDIAEALQAKGYEIDRKRISLRNPIKETGEYTVNVKLHREVVLPVPVTVSAEGGEVAEAKAEKKGKKAKAEAAEAEAAPAEATEATPEAPAAEAAEATEA